MKVRWEYLEQKEPAERSAGKKVLGVIRSIFIYILAIAIGVAALLFAADRSPTKSIFGYRYYTVITPSMTPTLKVGDIVIVKVGGVSSVKVDDIITFNPSSDTTTYLTHRVTEVLPDYFGDGITCFHTKGDANKDEDGFLLDESRVIGTVKFHIPKLGFVVRFIQLKWYLVLPLFAVFIIFLHLIKVYLDGGEENEEGSGEESESSTGKKEVPDDNRELYDSEKGAGSDNHEE